MDLTEFQKKARDIINAHFPGILMGTIDLSKPHDEHQLLPTQKIRIDGEYIHFCFTATSDQIADAEDVALKEMNVLRFYTKPQIIYWRLTEVFNNHKSDQEQGKYKACIRFILGY